MTALVTLADLEVPAPAGVDWTLALCAQVDPELFFPEKGASPAAAKRVCRTCPIQPACLAAVLERFEPYGIWAGTTPKERIELKKRSRRSFAVELVRDDVTGSRDQQNVITIEDQGGCSTCSASTSSADFCGSQAA